MSKCFLTMNLLILSLIIVTNLDAADSKNDVCPGKPGTLTCLKLNFEAFYRQNYNKFFDTYYYYAARAKSCKNYRDTADFFDVAYYIKGNAEVGEAFSSFSEDLLLSNPKCYLDSVILLKDESIKSLVHFYLNEPLNHDKDEIDKILNKFKNDSKYGRLMKLYWH